MRSSLSFPILPDHDKFMGGDKVRDIRGGDIHRVKKRFAIKDIDYITLQNVENGNEQTLVYFDVLPYLKLVCKPRILTNRKKIYVNEKEVETEKFVQYSDFYVLSEMGFCDYKRNLLMIMSDKYWEDVLMPESGIINIEDGMRFKFIPKASTSRWG